MLFKSNIPTIPAKKWTKLGPVLDWILGASLAHSILPAAFGKLGLGSLQAAAGGSNSSLAPANEYLDPALESDLTFSVMKGKRFKASLELLRDKERLATMWMFALAIEPLRYLSAWWLRRARETDRSPSRIPLFDMLLPECSPLQAARQYVATLLHSDGGDDRLVLLWRYFGFPSLTAWRAGRPAQIRTMRRFLLVVDASLFRRHVQTFRPLAWRILQLADPRVPNLAKDGIAAEWNGASVCCLTPGFARQLKQRGVSGNKVRQPGMWPEFFTQIARATSQQVEDLSGDMAAIAPDPTRRARHVSQISVWVRSWPKPSCCMRLAGSCSIR